eukprot:6211120-Pyramimonas_sp.AAC.1
MTVKARVSGVSTICWHASPSTMYGGRGRGEVTTLLLSLSPPCGGGLRRRDHKGTAQSAPGVVRCALLHFLVGWAFSTDRARGVMLCGERDARVCLRSSR